MTVEAATVSLFGTISPECFVGWMNFFVFLGVSQSSANLTGSLITASKLLGNFQNLQLTQQVGQWEMKMASANPYTLKVTGESPSRCTWLNHRMSNSIDV